MAGLIRTANRAVDAEILRYGGRVPGLGRMLGNGSGGGIDLPSITYSQSSVYTLNTAADNASMTNGVSAESVHTATSNDEAEQWVQMDLGSVQSVTEVVVGCDFSSTLAGGWGKTFTENLALEHSMDGTSWTNFGSTGTFTTGLKTFSVSFTARYIRLFAPFGTYIAVTEFYAT
jgi:hypothetical protein